MVRKINGRDVQKYKRKEEKWNGVDFNGGNERVEEVVREGRELKNRIEDEYRKGDGCGVGE